MKNGRKHGYFDEDQHSSRNGRNAVDIGSGKSFTMDMLHLKRLNMGCTDNNAKACYDWIIPLILLLAYVKAGLPYATGVFFVHILYNMQYHLAMLFEIASCMNFFALIAAIYGIGQGSMDGQPGWTCISDIILKCYHQLCKGCTITDPTNTLFDASGRPIIVPEEELSIIAVCVTDAHGNTKLLTRVSERKGIRMLGIYEVVVMDKQMNSTI
eukprot:9592197-Ditylum_brightwellii.AAC.1